MPPISFFCRRLFECLKVCLKKPGDLIFGPASVLTLPQLRQWSQGHHVVQFHGGKFTSSVHMSGTPWSCAVYNVCSHTLHAALMATFSSPCMMRNSDKLKNHVPTLMFPPSLRGTKLIAVFFWPNPSALVTCRTDFQPSWEMLGNGVEMEKLTQIPPHLGAGATLARSSLNSAS